MVIKEAVYTNSGVLSVASGAVSSLTGTDPASGLAGTPITRVSENAARSALAWFEGRLYAHTWSQGGGGPYNHYPRRLIGSTGAWEDVPDNGATFPLFFGNNQGSDAGTPGLIAFKDNIHTITHSLNEPNNTTSYSIDLAHFRWTPDPGANGDMINEGVKFTGTVNYTKTLGQEAAHHVLHVVEHSGVIYAATNFVVISFTPPNGSFNVLHETPVGAGIDQTRARSFGTFIPSTPGAVEQLFMVTNDGTVSQVTGTLTDVVDLTSINGNITRGSFVSNLRCGVAPACVQVGTEFFVFMNDDVNGVVMFKSSDPAGGTFVDVTSDLPMAWANNLDTHIHVITDPSVNGVNTPDGQVRVMFIDESSTSFDIYSFDGTTFTFLGNGSGPVLSYVPFDKDVVDVELEESATIDNSAGTATWNYQLFNEAGLTGTVSVIGEYSIDGGGTWTEASTAAGTTGTVSGGIGSGNGTITGLDASDSRPTGTGETETFVWDFEEDLGSGLFPNVRFRIRGI